MTRRNRTNPNNERKQTTLTSILPGRALGLAMAVLLVGVTLTSAAAAETSTHTVCIGDSENTDSPTEAGTGCATGIIETRDECEGPASDYDCTLEGRLTVNVRGPQTCGTTESSWFSNQALICVTIPKTVEGEASDQTDWETIGTYDDVPSGGITVEVPWDVCAWADRSDPVATFCDGPERPDDHTHHIDGPDGTAGGLDFVEGQVEYVRSTANNADTPVGVSP